MKVTYRTLTKVWEYPLTRRDAALNHRLRQQGEALGRKLDSYDE